MKTHYQNSVDDLWEEEEEEEEDPPNVGVAADVAGKGIRMMYFRIFSKRFTEAE